MVIGVAPGSGTVAVSVTGPLVAARQVARPLLMLCALLMEISSGSGLVQTGVACATHSGIGHPDGADGETKAVK